jgi:hypothetical protein
MDMRPTTVTCCPHLHNSGNNNNKQHPLAAHIKVLVLPINILHNRLHHVLVAATPHSPHAALTRMNKTTTNVMVPIALVEL